MVPDPGSERKLVSKLSLLYPSTAWLLFDWGDTLMRVVPEFSGPMITWPYLTALPEAEETLASLSTQYHLALATNAEDSDEEQIRTALHQVSLESYLEEIFCTRRLGYRKPEPEYFRSIANLLGVETNQIAMIGDSFTNDVIGAVGAGAQGIWLNTYSTEKRLGPGYFTVHSLGEIISFS